MGASILASHKALSYKACPSCTYDTTNSPHGVGSPKGKHSSQAKCFCPHSMCVAWAASLENSLLLMSNTGCIDNSVYRTDVDGQTESSQSILRSVRYAHYMLVPSLCAWLDKCVRDAHSEVI